MVPLSSRVRGLPHQVLVQAHHDGFRTGLQRDAEAITEQVHTVPETRVIHRIGQVPNGVLSQVLLAVHRFIATP
jgi:mRNA-degrading endonuclease toxin of MazEF toxin-antitoxin module